MTRPPIPILTYHQVAAMPPRGTPLRGLTVTPGAFARQMALLALGGWKGLSMSALEPYLRGHLTGRVVGITLDDGYANNLEHALPALRRHGFSATCYVVSAMLGGSNAWDHAQGIPPQRLMDLGELRAWVAGGQEVGAHTRHHADLRQLDAAGVRSEVTGCKAELEDLLGAPVRHFCYPYGHYDPSHVEAVREAGYRTATTTRRSRVLPQDGLLELPRAPVMGSTSLPVFWAKLATAYEDRRRR